MNLDSAALKLIEDARAFLEPRWAVWHEEWGPPAPQTQSQWTCVRSAAFLAFALEEKGFRAHPFSGRSLSKDPDEEGYGFRTLEGWQDHAWVVCGEHIVDVTADQFAETRVLVTVKFDERYRSGNCAATTLGLTPNGIKAVETLRLEWRCRQSPWPWYGWL